MRVNTEMGMNAEREADADRGVKPLYTYAFVRWPVALSGQFELPPGIAGSLQILTGKDTIEDASDYATDPDLASAENSLAALVEPDLDIAKLQTYDRQLVQAVLSHDRVIQSIFQQTTVLPLRFGTCFPSALALQAHLQSQRSHYAASLQQWADQAEYLLTLLPVVAAIPPLDTSLTGKAYFLAKKQHIQAEAEFQRQQQDEFNGLLAELAHHYGVHRSEAQAGVEKVYVLGDRRSLPDLVAQTTVWNRTCQYWRVTVGEALPPYHFMAA